MTDPLASATVDPFASQSQPSQPQPQAPSTSAAVPHAGLSHPNTAVAAWGEEQSTGDFDYFKGKVGQKDRLAVAMFLNGRALEPPFCRYHYTEELGYFLCLSEWDVVGTGGGKQEILKSAAICCDRLAAPRKRFGILVAVYYTTPAGKVMEPLGFSLKMWRVGPTLFNTLGSIHTEHGLDQHDLFVECTDEKYQRLTVQPAKERFISHPTILQKYPEVKNIDPWIQASYPKIVKDLARVYTPGELAQKMGTTAVAGSAIVLDSAAATGILDMLR